MHNVQLELAHERISERVRVAARGLDADKNFAVLKREHISRPGFSEKLPMQKRHPPIGNEPHEDLAQVAQLSLFPLSQFQATLHGRCRKIFKLANIEWNFSLKTLDGDPRRRRIAHRLLSIANFGFPAASTFLIVHTQVLLIGEGLDASIHLISSISVLSVGTESELNDSVA